MLTTTLSQSENLLRAGINPNTADCKYWSLDELLKLIPFPILTQQYDYKWKCSSYFDKRKISIENEDSPINAAYKMVMLLATKGNYSQ